MSHESELDHDQRREELWMQEQENAQQLIEKGSQLYFSELAENAQEDHETGLPCSCIDGRVSGFKMAIPGSGILENEEKAFQILKEANVTSISSHSDCGAANLAFSRLTLNEQQKFGTAENYSIAWTKKMADRLGIPYAGHHEVDTPGQHYERAIYYDASGKFNASVEGMPNGFTVSRKFLIPADGQSGLDLAIQIATGDHGFRGKFSKENPLVIVPVGNVEEMDGLKEEIDSVVAKHPEVEGAILVDSGYTPVVKESKEYASA